MSVYSRKLYDHCDLVEQDKMSKMPGNYATSKKPISNKRKIIPLTVGLVKDNYFNPDVKQYIGAYVDLDSHLRGIDLMQSKCTAGRTLNDLNSMATTIRSKLPLVTELADNKLLSSYTRLEQPAINLRSVTIPRFGFPITDPKEQIYYGTLNTLQYGDERMGTNSRREARDIVNMDEYLMNIDAGPPTF